MLEYSKVHCNIKGCNNRIFKHHMCQEHYERYVSNPIVLTYCNEQELLELPKPPCKLIIKCIVQSIIHHTMDYPMYLVEHFPLEHVFLGNVAWIGLQRKVDKKFVEHLIHEFDREENENIPMLKRMVDVKQVDEMEIEDVETYILDKRDLPPFVILMSVFVMGILFCYASFKVATNYDTVQFIKISFAYIIQMGSELVSLSLLYILYIYAGLKIPSLYAPLIRRAYELKLFDSPSDNLDVLIQAKYVKERNGKLASYKATLLGIYIAWLIAFFIIYLIYSSINYYTFLLFLGCACIVISYNLIAPLIVPYFPIYNSIKKKTPQILLQHGDMAGGLRDYLKLQFFTFLFNELFVILCYLIITIFETSIWINLIMIYACGRRLNHAAYSVLMSYKGIKSFYRQKGKLRQELEQSDACDTILKLDQLKKVKLIKLPDFIRGILLTIVIPLFISVAANNIDIVKNFFSNIIVYFIMCIEYLSF